MAQLQLQAASQVAVGGTVTLNLLAQSTEPVTNLPMTLGYDNSKLEVVNITEGPFLRSSGATSFSSRLSTNGQLTLSDAVTSGTGATAQGVYATVTFRALAAAQSTSIQVLSATPTGISGVPITLAPPAPFSLQITAK